MSKDGLYTSGTTAVSAKVDSIPLRDSDTTRPGQDSIGTLISNATEQVSTLVRSEIELAKTEMIGEAKKGAIGGGMFAVAGVIALYSTFFLFFALAEMLASWMHRGWAFLIVFLIMLALSGLTAFMGFKKMKKIKGPKRTINSVGELKNLKPGEAQRNLNKDESGLYTGPGTAPRAQTTRTETRTETRTVPTRTEVRTQPERNSRVTEVRTTGTNRTTGGSTAVTR